MKSAFLPLLLLPQTYIKSTSLTQLAEALSELHRVNNVLSKNETDDIASLASKIEKKITPYGTRYSIKNPDITILIYPKGDSPIKASIIYNGGEATPGGAEVALHKSGLLRIGKTSVADQKFGVEENIDPAQLSRHTDFLTENDIRLIKLGLKIFDYIQSNK